MLWLYYFITVIPLVNGEQTWMKWGWIGYSISTGKVMGKELYIYVCLILGGIMGGLYDLHFLLDIYSTISNIIAFSSIVIAVNSMFLFLLIALQESPVFQRLKDVLPSFQKRLFSCLKSQIQYGLIVVIFSVMISIFPTPKNDLLTAVIVAVYFYFFWCMTLGSFYAVKLITDIIVKNFSMPVRRGRP